MAPKTKLLGVWSNYITYTIAWIMMGTVFGSILLVTLIMLVIGWFKMISYFYMMRFGIKKPSLISRFKRTNNR